MEYNKNDGGTGGPAFPRTGEGFNNPNYDAPGMTLRQWYAGQALKGLIASCSTKDMCEQLTKQMDDNGIPHDQADKQFAKNAFQYADAMLKEGAK